VRRTLIFVATGTIIWSSRRAA